MNGQQSSIHNAVTQFQQTSNVFGQNPANPAVGHIQQGQQTVGQGVQTANNQMQQATNGFGQYPNVNSASAGALNHAGQWNQYPSSQYPVNGVQQQVQNAAQQVGQQTMSNYQQYLNLQQQGQPAVSNSGQNPAGRLIQQAGQQATNNLGQFTNLANRPSNQLPSAVQNGFTPNHWNQNHQSNAQNVGNRFNPQLPTGSTQVQQFATGSIGQTSGNWQIPPSSGTGQQFSTTQTASSGSRGNGLNSGTSAGNGQQTSSNGHHMLDHHSQHLANRKFLDTWHRQVLPNVQQPQISGSRLEQIQLAARNTASRRMNSQLPNIQPRGAIQSTQTISAARQNQIRSALSSGISNISNTAAANVQTRPNPFPNVFQGLQPAANLNQGRNGVNGLTQALGNNPASAPTSNLFNSLTNTQRLQSSAQTQLNPLANIFRGLQNTGNSGTNQAGTIRWNNATPVSPGGLLGSLPHLQGVPSGLSPQPAATGNTNLLGGLDVLGSSVGASSPLSRVLSGVNAQSVGNGALAGVGLPIDGDQCDVAACDGSFEQMESQFRQHAIGQLLQPLSPIFAQFRNCKQKADRNYFQQMQSQFDLKTLMSNGFDVSNINTALQNTCMQGLKSEERKCKNLQCIMCKFIAPRCGPQPRGKRQATKQLPERIQHIFGNLPMPQSENPSWDNYRTRYARLPNLPGGPNDPRYKQACVNEKVDFTEILKLFREVGSVGEAERTCQGLSKSIQNPNSLGNFIQGRANAGILGGTLGGILSGR